MNNCDQYKIFLKPYPPDKHIIGIILQNYCDKKLFPSKEK